MKKRLYRSSTDSRIGGVCGGLGEYFNFDPLWLRIIWGVTFLAYGSGFLLYLIFWIFVPRKK